MLVPPLVLERLEFLTSQAPEFPIGEPKGKTAEGPELEPVYALGLAWFAGSSAG